MDKLTKVFINEHIEMAACNVNRRGNICAYLIKNLLDNICNVIRDSYPRPIPKDVRLMLFNLDTLKGCYCGTGFKCNWTTAVSEIKRILKFDV